MWDRRIEKNIGNIESSLLDEPSLAGYAFPDPENTRFFADIPQRIASQGDRFRVFAIGSDQIIVATAKEEITDWRAYWFAGLTAGALRIG